MKPGSQTDSLFRFLSDDAETSRPLLELERHMLMSGRCHCGNISFELRWMPEPIEIPARACTCTFCAKHGGVWTSCPSGSLTVSISKPARVSRYSFATRTAEFLVCSDCGVAPVVTSQVGERVYAVVNVNTLEGIDPTLLRPVSATFDDESEAERLARRSKNWIPDVVFA